MKAPPLGKRRLVALCIAAASALTVSRSTFASTPTLDVSQYTHNAWRVADGFAKGPIYSVAQTPDGYLWIATDFGVLRFDGVRTTSWSSDNLLPSQRVQTLLVGREGTLWIGTSFGLVSWRDGKLTTYPELAHQFITATIEAHDGTVWVIVAENQLANRSGGRVCAVRDGGVRCWGQDGSFGSQMTTLYEDSKGSLWVGDLHGIWQWNQDRPKFYPSPNNIAVQALNEDADGRLLVLMAGGIYRFVNGRHQEVYRIPVTLVRPLGRAEMLRDRDGGLWIGTPGAGLIHAHDGKFDRFSNADGLSGDSVEGLFQDREGNIWVSTLDGLDRFRKLLVTPFTRRQGFSSTYVLAVLASTDGSVWVRTSDGGLNHWADGNVTVYHDFPGGGSLFEDERHRIWVSSLQSTKYFDHGRFYPVPMVPPGRVFAMTGDSTGNLWLAHDTTGLIHLAGDGVDSIPWSRFGHTDYADALAIDPSTGGLWVAYLRGGLQLVKDGRVLASYQAADGLVSERLRDLRVGSDGALWFTSRAGVSRLNDGRIARLSADDGLPCSEADWTIEDDAGDSWFFLECGLVRIARRDIDAWTNAAITERRLRTAIPLTSFGRPEGVQPRAGGAAFTPPVAKATDGRLWFFPRGGLSVIDPRDASLKKPSPPVSIEQISADRTSYGPSRGLADRLRLPALIRDLEIEYTALSFVAPEAIQFRYLLEGYDRDWQNAGSRRQAFYTNLRPGSYRFRVTARNSNGAWNEAGAALDFSIAPAYFQTIWFRSLVAMVAVSLLWVAYRYRLRQLAHTFDVQLQGRVDERIRIARDLHDTLLQSFHGLLFRLQAANNLLPDRPVEAKRKFEGAIDQAAQALTEGRDAVQNLRSAAVDGEELAVAITTLSQELANAGIDGRGVKPVVNVEVRGTMRALRPVLRDDVYRIAGEALRNAFRHADARHIEVEIRYDAKHFQLRVRDDGSGIDPTVLDDRSRGHFGLPGMRERADVIGGSLDVWTQAGLGTEVDLKVAGYAAYAAPEPRTRFWSRGRRIGRLS